MRKVLMSAAASLLLAAPALAQAPVGDSEVQQVVEWQALVAQARAHATAPAALDIAAARQVSATDAGVRTIAAAPRAIGPTGRPAGEEWRDAD